MAFGASPFADANAINSEVSSIAPHSRHGSDGTAPSREGGEKEKHQFRSYRLVGEYERPWVNDKRMKRSWINSLIVYLFALVGLAVAGYICYTATASVPKHDYCLILDEQFKTLDQNTWSHEVQLGGFGAGSFDWTTSDPANSFVDAEGLHIVPTLTNVSIGITDEQIYSGYTVNLTADGTCTDPLQQTWNCVLHSNNSLGYTIPPVRSARLSTKGKKSIKYGKVEVVAKMPVGDWLWPAIWMMPEESKYGDWPRSGEIDIAESRGNDYSYSLGGRDTYTSSMHWGPNSAVDAFWRTTAGRKIRRTDFSKSFHTFGIEWSEDYLYTYLDTHLQHILYLGFKGKNSPQTMWDRGDFGHIVLNNSFLENPWAASGTASAPFDQSFYLILNVAVGSRNGWFLDGVGDKPWVDASTYLAPGNFYSQVNKWYPTWGKGNDRGMTVKSIKMWQEGKC